MMKLPNGYLKVFSFRLSASSIWKYTLKMIVKSVLINVVEFNKRRKMRGKEKLFYCVRLVPTLLIYISAIDYSYFVPIKWLSLITSTFDWFGHKTMRTIEPNRKWHRHFCAINKMWEKSHSNCLFETVNSKWVPLTHREKES